ncbi:carabin-like isoform X2 [Corticium candelabrum]|uniref:carabin-like isoform X2 n=1 Tax=Corticium candelabrum TaxID=121492 RepID=UPI002E256557|nr:carabin-like isoform X2 [Corticium candelabrum]
MGTPGVELDKYGFLVSKSDDDYRQHKYPKEEPKVSEFKWEKMLNNLQSGNGLESSQKLYRYIGSGIPNAMRGRLWAMVVESEKMKENSQFEYQDEKQKISRWLDQCGLKSYADNETLHMLSDVENISVSGSSPEMNQLSAYRQILLDVGRSFPNHNQFAGNEGKAGRSSLFFILSAYVSYNQSVGYCQGMSFVAGVILMHLDEEDAFWVMTSLFERKKYLLGYFSPTLAKIKSHAEVFQQLLNDRSGTLAKHLTSLGVYPLMYVTQWFLSLFTSLPCWDTVLMIWDYFMVEGVTCVFRIALSLVQLLSDRLLATEDMSVAILLFKRFPHDICTRQVLATTMTSVTVHDWEINGLLDKTEKTNTAYIRRGVKRSRDSSMCVQTSEPSSKQQRPVKERSKKQQQRVKRQRHSAKSVGKPRLLQAGEGEEIEMTPLSIKSKSTICCSSSVCSPQLHDDTCALFVKSFNTPTPLRHSQRLRSQSGQQVLSSSPLSCHEMKKISSESSDLQLC